MAALLKKKKISSFLKLLCFALIQFLWFTICINMSFMLLKLDVSQVVLGKKALFPQYGKTKGFFS